MHSVIDWIYRLNIYFKGSNKIEHSLARSIIIGRFISFTVTLVIHSLPVFVKHSHSGLLDSSDYLAAFVLCESVLKFYFLFALETVSDQHLYNEAESAHNHQCD